MRRSCGGDITLDYVEWGTRKWVLISGCERSLALGLLAWGKAGGGAWAGTGIVLHFHFHGALHRFTWHWAEHRFWGRRWGRRWEE